ncbi:MULTISPECIES: hypothetical protein [unclassified Methylobacterium]|uniref:hypothetical protein n=1 Tax=unclassified Methylobacterium TaxID=2615210 RepID=UPI002269C074|nr:MULTISPECIES: hypothetical protein [unclassified Methylobacterium]
MNTLKPAAGPRIGSRAWKEKRPGRDRHKINPGSTMIFLNTMNRAHGTSVI